MALVNEEAHNEYGTNESTLHKRISRQSKTWATERVMPLHAVRMYSDQPVWLSYVKELHTLFLMMEHLVFLSLT